MQADRTIEAQGSGGAPEDAGGSSSLLIQAVQVKIARQDLFNEKNNSAISNRRGLFANEKDGDEEAYVNTFRVSKLSKFFQLKMAACQYWGIEEKLYQLVWSD